MPFVLKRPRHQKLARAIADAVRSLYTSSDRRSVQSEDAYSREYTSSKTRIRAHSHTFHKLRQNHPIERLLNELLAHIFSLGAEDDAMFPVNVSHVCRAWRRLALHTPSVWRRIALDSRLEMWSQRILRAKACTLDIQLAPRALALHGMLYKTTFDARTVQLYFHLVIPLIERWRTLEIQFETYAPYLWNAALSACCAHSSSVHAPHLRELCLVYPGNDDTKEFALFDGNAPRLRRVTLLGIRLAWTPSLFHNLTYLDYTHHGFTGGHEAASEVLHILQVSARLEELRLAFPWRIDGADPYADSSLRPVTLSCLSTLVVSIEGPEVPSALLLVLLHLSLPTTRSLRLLSRYPFRRPTLFPRLRHVLRALPELPKLEHLYLEHGWLDPRFVFPLLHSIPRLRYLALQGLRVTGPFLRGLADALRAQREEFPLCPPLAVLELVRCSSLTAEDVRNALGGRSVSKASPSIEVLLVRDCGGIEPSALRELEAMGSVTRVIVRASRVAGALAGGKPRNI